MASSTRDALVQAATGLLDDGGVEAVTLREVGRLAGVSHNAPYKHFASKEALLAAIAARELVEQTVGLTRTTEASPTPEGALRATLYEYVAWARRRPARFKLTFGSWSVESPELAAAAHAAQGALVELVARVQDSGRLPAGDPERMAALLQALAHGAADLAAAGHLDADGKGHASPADLVDDLLEYLNTATAQVTSPPIT
ncbi:TetR/AcrR family transcriptional regulator [Jiangella asiatica]|uniref:TetR/AcrR family transcriptional regulator n=1 Tax=Jiangella asiatica TaxID=2530372 RepID=A0A4R5DLJ0_9ACTN|nr:TetR/AcrR family transcriptional regulator [Jiangella asiatica]TDE14297.1 TetR/AcrR family transcriptional regulator [Jiangella asiatica]